jgi:hypothetical protein
LLEREPLHPEQVRRGALAISNDGRQHDSAIDFRPAPLTGSRGSRLQNSFQIRRNKNLRRRVRIPAMIAAADVGGHLPRQPGQIDI